MFVAGILPLLLSARRLRSCQRLEPSLAVPFRPSRLVILWYLSLGRLASGRLPFHALRMSTLKSPAMNPTPGGRVAADDGDDDNTDGVDEPCPTPTCIILDRTNPPTSTTCAIRATVSGASRFPPPPDCRCVLKRSTSQAELANRIASLCCPWTRRTRAAPRTCGEKKCSNGCVSLGSRARSHTLSLSLSLSVTLSNGIASPLRVLHTLDPAFGFALNSLHKTPLELYASSLAAAWKTISSASVIGYRDIVSSIPSLFDAQRGEDRDRGRAQPQNACEECVCESRTSCD